MEYEISDELVKYSQTVRVLFAKCVGREEKDVLSLFNIFFSNIDVVYDGMEALEHFKTNKYDLIITGLNLPKINGMELISKIRDISKNVTILAISSTTDKYDFTELIKLGIDGFIIRPVYVKQFSEVMHKTIEKLKIKQDLYEHRIDLEKKVQEQITILREKDKILSYQSKLAAMGEMMDAVAHQWKQPLNIINMRIDMLRYDQELGLVDKNYCDTLYNNITAQTMHMKTTLDEFRTFLRPNKKKNIFSISLIIDNVLLLVHDELMKYNITIEKNIQDDLKINGIENEFKHLILNLISNSKDAFIENDIKERVIKFNLYKQDENIILEVADNAGGIPSHIISTIFNANVTTKEAGKGTGIGLYMSKQIVKKHHGEISVMNIDNGSVFIIKI